MKDQETLDFARIAEAIEYIRNNFKQQPSLDDVARQVSLSTPHFQRMFTQWAGVSPKKFLQFTTLSYAKTVLGRQHATLADAADATGLSGTGRLHDLFIHIEGMTPGEYKNGGENLSINYSTIESPFGKMLVASTDKGICCMEFIDDTNLPMEILKVKFPNARFQNVSDEIQQRAMAAFGSQNGSAQEIKLHLKGTDFQLKVWEALLNIPSGSLTTYGDIASDIHNAKACRAVGTAIAENPVAFIIPCHRVIRSTGEFGNYHWGELRKAAIIGWEAAQKNG